MAMVLGFVGNALLSALKKSFSQFGGRQSFTLYAVLRQHLLFSNFFMILSVPEIEYI